MDKKIGDGPVEFKYIQDMIGIADEMDELFNPGMGPGDTRKVGFILMVFEFGQAKGRCNYISTAERNDVEQLLKDQLKYFEDVRNAPAR